MSNYLGVKGAAGAAWGQTLRCGRQASSSSKEGGKRIPHHRFLRKAQPFRQNEITRFKTQFSIKKKTNLKGVSSSL